MLTRRSRRTCRPQTDVKCSSRIALKSSPWTPPWGSSAHPLRRGPSGVGSEESMVMVTFMRFVLSWISWAVHDLSRVSALSVGLETVQVSKPHTRLETHRHQQKVWKKSHGVWLEAFRHQLEDNLPPSDFQHHTNDTGFETRGACFRGLLLPF